MNNSFKVLFNICVFTILIVLYQNCGSKFDSNTAAYFIETQSSSSNHYVIKENEVIITKLNSSEVLVEWSLEGLTSAIIDYGFSESNLNRRVVNESFLDRRHSLTLKELSPSTNYFYQITSETKNGDIYKSSIYKFKTDDSEILDSDINPTVNKKLIKEGDIIITSSFDEVDFEWDIGEKSQAYIEFGLTENLGTIQYRETSFEYSSHKQSIKKLEAKTPYYYQITSVTEQGLEYKSDINQFTTKEKPIESNIHQANYIDFSDFPQKDRIDESKSGPEVLREGQWQGVHGSTSPGGFVKSWQRVTITANKFFGASRKLLLDSSIKEAWASYQVQLGSNWTPTDGVKLPGFTGHHNGGSTGIAGGNGGGWAGLCRSWSARTIISPPGKYNGLFRTYLYHKGNTNYSGGAQASDHPCINKSNAVPYSTKLRRFGNMVSGSETIKGNKWHTITHHVKLNDIGKANGLIELFVDGKLAGRQINISFTDNPKYHNIAFWFQVYHGGSADKSGTNHDLFFHGFNWNAGPINKTKIKFDEAS